MKVYGLLYSLGLCLLVVGTTTPQSGRTSSLVMTPKQRAAYQQRRAAGSEQLRQQMGFDVSIDAALENPTTWARDFITVKEMPNWENQYTSAQIDQFAANISSALTEIANLRQSNDLTRENLGRVVDNLQVPNRIKKQFNQTIVKPLRLELARGTAVRAGMGAGRASESAAESAERARLASLAAADAQRAAEQAEADRLARRGTLTAEPEVITPEPAVVTPAVEPEVVMHLPEGPVAQKYRDLAENAQVKDAIAQGTKWFAGLRGKEATEQTARHNIAVAIQKIADLYNQPETDVSGKLLGGFRRTNADSIAAFKNDIWKAGRGMNPAWNESTLEAQFDNLRGKSAEEIEQAKEEALDAIIARYVTNPPVKPELSQLQRLDLPYTNLEKAVDVYLRVPEATLGRNDRALRKQVLALKTALLTIPTEASIKKYGESYAKRSLLDQPLASVWSRLFPGEDMSNNPQDNENRVIEQLKQLAANLTQETPETLWSTTESMGPVRNLTRADLPSMPESVSSAASSIRASLPDASSLPTRESLRERASGIADSARSLWSGSSSSSAAPVASQAEGGFSPEQYDRAVSGPAMEDLDEAVTIRTQEPESSAVSSRSRSEQARQTSGQTRSFTDFSDFSSVL